MREFKFRAWDKTNQIMESPAQWLAVEFNGNLINTAVGKRAVRHDYVIMQSTGMTDSDGVEIFEGDMVQTDGLKSILTIVWDKETLSFRLVGGPFNLIMATRQQSTILGKRRLTVIGNKFENAELLK